MRQGEMSVRVGFAGSSGIGMAAGAARVSLTTAPMSRDLGLALDPAADAELPLPVTSATLRSLVTACAGSCSSEIAVLCE